MKSLSERRIPHIFSYLWFLGFIEVYNLICSEYKLKQKYQRRPTGQEKVEKKEGNWVGER